MFTDKEKVLSNAPSALNNANQPWEVIVENDTIIAYWKWMDATFFGPNEINDETKEFKFKVTLNEKGKWREMDSSEKKSISLSKEDGGLKFGASKSGFMGKTMEKTIVFGLGKDNQTGAFGIIKNKFNTSLIKEPIRQYLKNCGWKKSGLFW